MEPKARKERFTAFKQALDASAMTIPGGLGRNPVDITAWGREYALVRVSALSFVTDYSDPFCLTARI
jgi:hypothetical protein